MNTVADISVVPVVPGAAAGPILRLTQPLSFWGGLSSAAGEISDVHHPQHGAVVTSTVLVLPGGRGSSSASSVLAEAIRIGTAPAALIMTELDEIIALGSFVAEELYGSTCPIAIVSDDSIAALQTGRWAELDGARLRVTPSEKRARSTDR